MTSLFLDSGGSKCSGHAVYLPGFGKGGSWDPVPSCTLHLYPLPTTSAGAVCQLGSSKDKSEPKSLVHNPRRTCDRKKMSGGPGTPSSHALQPSEGLGNSLPGGAFLSDRRRLKPAHFLVTVDSTASAHLWASSGCLQSDSQITAGDVSPTPFWPPRPPAVSNVSIHSVKSYSGHGA